MDNNTNRIKQDTESLADLLVDPGMLTGNPAQCRTEVGKRAIDIYNQFDDDPAKVRFGHVQDLAVSEGTQIGNPGMYLAHILNTGGVFRSMVRVLERAQPEIALPHPDVAYATGLIHDLNATFSDYGKGGQQSKEFDQFLLARRLGWPTIAKQVSMHSDYMGAIRLMAKGVDFPKKDAYSEMIGVLRSEGPLSYKAIAAEFADYLSGEDMLPLMLLTVADYIENGKPYFNAETFEKDFDVRSGDILWRYHGKALQDGNTPSLLGQALVDGGLERIGLYKRKVAELLKAE
jgi:hypothetical protein